MMLRRATATAVRSSRRHLSTQNLRYQTLQTESSSIAVPAIIPSPKFAQVYDQNFDDKKVPDAPIPQAVRAIYHAPIKVPAQFNVPACDLQIRSFSVKNVEFFCDFALRAAYYLHLPAFGPIPLPRRTERWTVPKSNFVHKKAQQNFERVTFKRLIQIKDANPEVVQVWLAFLRKHEYHGIGMKANVYSFEKLGTGTHMAEKLAEIKQKAADGADHNQQLTAIRKAFNTSHNLPDTKSRSASGKKAQTALTARINKLVPALGKSEATLNDLRNEIKKKGFMMGFNQAPGPRLNWDRPQYARKSWITILERLEKEMKGAAMNMDSILADMNITFGKNWRSRMDLKPEHKHYRGRLFAAEDRINESFKEIKSMWKALHMEHGEKWGSRLGENRPVERLWKERVEAKPRSEKETAMLKRIRKARRVQAVNSKSEASSGHPEEHMPRELEEAQEETNNIPTSPSEGSSGHPEDHLPREMEEGQEEQKPLEAASAPAGSESEAQEALQSVKEESASPTAETSATNEAAHPEPTASEDGVAADKIDIDPSKLEPLDTRTAKEIQVDTSSTDASAAESIKKENKEEDTKVPEPPRPTESESIVAADSEFVPEPTHEGAQEKVPDAKEIQVEEATKKDN